MLADGIYRRYIIYSCVNCAFSFVWPSIYNFGIGIRSRYTFVDYAFIVYHAFKVFGVFFLKNCIFRANKFVFFSKCVYFKICGIVR